MRTINAELAEFSPEMADKEQWLLFNKTDVMPADEAKALCDKALKKLKWKGRSYRISAVAHTGLEQLCRDAMDWVEAHAPPRVEASDDAPEMPESPNSHASDSDGSAETEE